MATSVPSLLTIVSELSKCTQSLNVIYTNSHQYGIYLLVAVRVDNMQELFDFVVTDNLKVFHKHPVFLLIDYAIVVSVHCFELVNELSQEFLVLFQLEVQNRLEEESESQFEVCRLGQLGGAGLATGFFRGHRTAGTQTLLGLVRYLLGLLLHSEVNLVFKYPVVILIIHFLDDLLPHPVVDAPSDHLLHHFAQFHL